jgi:hypothetical protein
LDFLDRNQTPQVDFLGRARVLSTGNWPRQRLDRYCGSIAAAKDFLFLVCTLLMVPTWFLVPRAGVRFWHRISPSSSSLQSPCVMSLGACPQFDLLLIIVSVPRQIPWFARAWALPILHEVLVFPLELQVFDSRAR